MSDQIRLSGSGVVLGLGIGMVLLAGCSDASQSQPGVVVRERVARGPVEPRRFVTTPQAPVARVAAELDLSPAPAVSADSSLDARLLVITADGTDPAYPGIADALRYLGVPFDTFNATIEPDLTADRLANGNHGFYYGVILDRGNLSVGTVSALSATEWAVLSTYEAQFQVRRVALYAYPEATYGLLAGDGFDTTTTPLSIHCTATGAAVFAETNCSAGLTVTKAWAYPAATVGTTTVPILVDDSGRVFGAISTDSSDHEYMALTFAQAPTLVHSLALFYDVVHWVTRGVFLGERHVYVTPQIDDLFLASNIYPHCSGCGDAGVDGGALGDGTVTTVGDGGTVAGLTYRITDLDLQALADWQLGPQAQFLTANLRVAWAFNGVGAAAVDPLTARVGTLAPAFNWISHTWDHALLDTVSYAAALAEFTRNDALVSAMGLQPYDIRNLVTPAVSGLNNPDAMRAAFDAGIRFMVGDTSVAGWDNPSPNAGIHSLLQPAVLIIPRRPTNLFYNVSTPDVWLEEYNAIYHSYWGRDLTYAEILDFESNVLLQHLLRGESDPWMFHQANVRDYGGGRSLLSDLLDAALTKYAAISKFPVVGETMDAIGGRVGRRMVYDRAQATAVIGPGSQITVRASNAASVPVTGLCTPSAETYAGQKITYLQLEAGAETTLSLIGCNDGGGGAGGPGAGGGSDAGDAGVTVVGGAGGAGGGAGGIVGAGGSDGAGGAGGMVDAAGTGGIAGRTEDAGQTPPDRSSTGCGGCSLAERSPAAGAIGLAFAVAMLGTRRRRSAIARTKRTAG